MIEYKHRVELKNNNYDYSLIMLVCLLVFGMYGESWQPIRIVALVSVPFSFYSYLKTRNLKPLNHAFKISTLLFVWISITFLWTSDTEQGLKEIIYYFTHFSLFILVLLLYFKANNPLKSLTKGWLILISITLICAFVEIFYNQHLSVNLIPDQFKVNVDGVGYLKKFASVTFGNYNTYILVICMALPFLFGFLYSNKNYFTQFFTILVITSTYFVILINASRGGILVGGVLLIVWGIFAQKYKVHHSKEKIAILLPIALYIVFNHTNMILQQLFNRVSGGGTYSQSEGRTELFESAFDAFLERPLFGSGIGSIQVEMENVLIKFPHNLVMEFLVQFGLIATLIIGIILMFVFKNILKLSSFSKDIAISILVVFPIIIIINSTYLLHPLFWVFIASIYCISCLNKSNFAYD